jgi:hypothetical protein
MKLLNNEPPVDTSLSNASRITGNHDLSFLPVP